MITLIFRIVVIVVIAFLAGSAAAPLMWRPAIVQQSREILSPYAMISTAILIAAIGYAIGQWNRGR